MNIKNVHTHVQNNDESTDKRGIKACTYHHIVIQVNNKELHAAKHSNRPFIIWSSLFTIDLQFYSLQGHLFISVHKSIPLLSHNHISVCTLQVVHHTCPVSNQCDFESSNSQICPNCTCICSQYRNSTPCTSIFR